MTKKEITNKKLALAAAFLVILVSGLLAVLVSRARRVDRLYPLVEEAQEEIN